MNQTTDITTCAMLVKLSISQWNARKLDKRITREVATQHGAPEDSGRYNKSLIARDHLQAVQKTATTARTYHYANTLPWHDDGWRLLPAANFERYSAQMRSHETDFWAAVACFTANYPAYVDDARRTLNGLFNPADYPADGLIDSLYNWQVEIAPVPAATDFRVALNQSVIQQIQTEIETRNATATHTAMRDLWQRLYDVVDKAARTLADPDAKYKDTLIGNIREIVDLLPALNIANDIDLESMRRQAAAYLANEDPQALRTNVNRRKAKAYQADEIAKQMAAYMGGSPDASTR